MRELSKTAQIQTTEQCMVKRNVNKACMARGCACVRARSRMSEIHTVQAYASCIYSVRYVYFIFTFTL